MSWNEDRLTPEDKVLNEIEALVVSRLRPEARVRVTSYYTSYEPGGKCGRIQIKEHDAPYQQGISHEPGIPYASLVPEKILPIAKWIVRQFSKDHQEWFKPDDEE